MKMIPPRPHDTGSSAEQKVFEKFSDSTALGGDALCLHSLNIANHVSLRFGEADFVMVCPWGLFVFEVKGGAVSREAGGVWHFKDRFGKDHINRRGPFVQAREALHSIKEMLEGQLDCELIKRMYIGFGVIMPDCPFDITGVEWDSRTILTATCFDRFDSWLKQLAGYWISRDKRPDRRGLSIDDIERIKACLRPEFDQKLPFSVLQRDIRDRMDKHTRAQLRLLDVLEANQRVICSGGPGTGKNEMALELARRLGWDGRRVLFVSDSLWLIRFFQTGAGNRSIIFSTLEELKAWKEKGIKFDILIINEGRGELNSDNLKLLNGFVRGGFTRGRWYLFHDTNFQETLHGAENHGVGAFQYLLGMNPVKIPLKKNCRNTTPILKAIQSITQCSAGEDGTGSGPEVKLLHCDSSPESALAQELKRLTGTESLPLGDITILSPVSFKNSCANRLNSFSKSRIHVLDENSVRKIPLKNKIAYASIYDFRGLESPCVVLVDFCSSDFKQKRFDLYHGMSCAVFMLSLIISKGSEDLPDAADS